MTGSLASLWSLPGLRVVARLGPVRVLRVLAIVYVIGFAVAVLMRESVNPLAADADPMTYLAAGERLNAGHALYALSPGDREVPMSPPYWSVPLLAPPPIAVLWRPLALVGEPAAVAWWIGGVLAMVSFIVWLLARGSATVLIATVLLTPALALTALSGNASAYLIPLLALAWVRRDRSPVVAAVVIAAAAIKLTPAVFLIWLVIAHRWRAVGAAVLIGLLVLVASLVGAGAQNHLAWITTVPLSSPVPLSLAAWTGLPAVVVAATIAVLAAVAAAVSCGRGREDLAFSACAVAASAATPAFYFAALAALLVAVVPRVRARTPSFALS